MPGWAKELAEKIRLQELLRQQEFEKAQLRKKLYAEHAPALWLALVDVLQADMREFNLVFEDEPKNQVLFERFPENLRVPPQRVTLRRQGYVTAHLETWFEMDMEGIEYRVGRRVAHEGVSHEKKGLIKILMDPTGSVSMSLENRKITPAEASQILLRPVLTP